MDDGVSRPQSDRNGFIARRSWPLELRRLACARTTLRTQKVRTAVLDWECAEEDNVAGCLAQFNDHTPSALVELLRSAAGCRWAIQFVRRSFVEY